MAILSMLLRKSKENDLELKNKYLNKSICLNRGKISIVYHVHKVKHGWLYCYNGYEEIKFRPYEISLD